jgi:phosphohistidine phosphatase
MTNDERERRTKSDEQERRSLVVLAPARRSSSRSSSSFARSSFVARRSSLVALVRHSLVRHSSFVIRVRHSLVRHSSLTMLLYLVHHADALSPDIDPARPLSASGHAQAESVADRVAARGAKPAAIWHSGKRRARQTGEIYWRRCNPLASFTASRGLQPNDDPRTIRDELVGEADDLMIVGHYPHLPALLQLLTGEGRAFPQHGAVALERVETKWIERWREERLTT